MSLSSGPRAALCSAGMAALLALAATGVPSTAAAQILRDASAFDPNSLDPHSLAMSWQAIATMLAQVTRRVTFQPSPSATFFPKLTQANASFFEFGWSPGADPWATMNSIVRSDDGAGSSQFNGGRYSSPKLDQRVDGIRVEPDLATRRHLVGDALQLMHDDLPLIPRYRRTLTWVMRPHIEVAMCPMTRSNCAGCAATEP